jgi:hypothetical protein
MLSQARPSVVTYAKAGVVGKSEPIKPIKINKLRPYNHGRLGLNALTLMNVNNALTG